MKRSEVIQELSYRAGVAPEDCEYVVDALGDVIADALAKGEKVMLRNFAIFEVVTRKARRGRDPKTGEVIKYPKTKAVRCRIGQRLKDAASGNLREDYGSFRD